MIVSRIDLGGYAVILNGKRITIRNFHGGKIGMIIIGHYKIIVYHALGIGI